MIHPTYNTIELIPKGLAQLEKTLSTKTTDAKGER